MEGGYPLEARTEGVLGRWASLEGGFNGREEYSVGCVKTEEGRFSAVCIFIYVTAYVKGTGVFFFFRLSFSVGGRFVPTLPCLLMPTSMEGARTENGAIVKKIAFLSKL